MKILLISDVHDKVNKLQAYKELIKNNRPYDLVLFAGDLTSKQTREQQFSQYQVQEMFFKKLFEYTQSKCYYVLGNHELQQCQQYEDENTTYVGNNISDFQEIQIVGLDGSDYSVACSDEYGAVMSSRQFKPQNEKQFYEQQLHEVQFLKNNQRMDESSIIEFVDQELINFQSNEQFQIANQLLQRVTKNCIVLAHQGLKESPTTYFSSPEKFKLALTGSLAYSKAFKLHEKKIINWVHGHTHHYQKQQDEKVINTGIFVVNGISILDSSNNKLEKIFIDEKTDPE